MPGAGNIRSLRTYKLRVTSVVLDGEARCFTNAIHDFEKLWSNCFDETVRLCALDLLELKRIAF